MNPSTAQAAVIVDELVRGGVSDIVLCPGSRNAPLSFALYKAATAGRVRLHVRIDERTAGFLAVGLAVASGRPAVVVMTSGTAVANLGPAVLEANYARVPLVVLSANRPYELLGSGANQTVEQFGLFGTQVRAAISIGLAEPESPGADSSRQNAAWRTVVCRVLAEASGTRSRLAGPVQFDVPLREPLVPEADWTDGQEDQDAFGGGTVGGDALAAAHPGRADGAPWTRVPQAATEVRVPLDLTADTVVIAGHGAGHHPELDGLPTIAEPTSRQRGVPTHPWALLSVRPRQAVILGRPTLHRPVSALLARPDVDVIALTTGPRWPDVSGNVVLTGTTPDVAGAPSEEWLRACAEADRRARAAIDDGLDEHVPATGLHVARAVLRGLRAGDQLVLGASNPVRDVSLAGRIPDGVAVRSNRGVAGIDGTVSTAVGAALAHPGRTVALLGDLTFLHDASGLLIGRSEPRPDELTIVVANDEGGGIFALLEQGEPRYSDAFERVFGTPHDANLAALCAAYGVTHRKADPPELAGILAETGRRPGGIEVIEVTTHREGLRGLHEALRGRVS
ncbi:2-succinyl-5-enolpyruvyl-6-hydroxy-3-cyclohexene-1-carboxylic-acid synthase [Tomitella fengzijianii]|uniref:2-succinyl-5-enolpyruvyl-6-hydroxy-3-cyclohexene-1-carboxylate synthase n=1 Tax=Tomitella fengzijianii TaxID=2597660 RepID=A0A516X0C3_9ACTN|nr:2-succinyl-5-enolpyruvyl-6-hydroxy-3-cyclohexene-1-carboxylic-acid synthase [Tomitella fengzijianii]QDQ96532.1 2-succinyl-5-enolpyruvyl-6-hydroxy-3-cyclohexene-1-carboxylic-acid synthase [Tomitella fengzijianii]